MSANNMDNLELLTNDDLRLRLLQYGFENTPVTTTTRRVLIKKLRNHVQNEKSKLRKDSSYAARYSSGDDSDRDTDSKKKGNIARKTISHPTAAISQTKPYSRATTIPTRPLAVQQRTTMPPPSTTRSTMKYPSGGSPKVSDRQYLLNDSEEDSDYRLPRSNVSSESPPYLRNRFTLNNSPGDSNGHDPDSSPFVSDFTKRLLKLRQETVSNENNQRRNQRTSSMVMPQSLHHPQQQHQMYRHIDKDDIVFHAQPSSTTQRSGSIGATLPTGDTDEKPNVPLNIALSNFINKLDEYYGVKQTFIPCVLLTSLLLFFTFVAFIYLTISPDIINTINTIDPKYERCTGLLDDIPSVSCIPEDEMESTMSLLKTIATELQRLAEHNKCVDKKASYSMSAKDIIMYAAAHDTNTHVLQIMQDLHNVEYLIELNPHWQIKNIDSDGRTLKLDKIVPMRTYQSNFLAIPHPSLPFTCLIYNKFHTFFFIVGSVALVLIAIYLLQLFFRYVVFVKQSRKEQVNNLINDITNAVMEQAIKEQNSSPENSLVVVNHLRDKLIPLLKRKELEWAWVAAIKYLENNESRIQFEVGNRNGEDQKMMRWIDSVPQQTHSTYNISTNLNNNRSSVKKWQSPAFDKTNKISDPPTECLKIRQMFDKYEINDPSLKTVIQDAILEKVGSQCKIYDVQLDKGTCCVYVRCATRKDAGIVHDEINGWWLENRLISIKFLRLERYLSRFPKSLSGPICLKPSNTNNASMTHYNNNNHVNNHNEYEDDDDDDEDEDDDGSN